MTRLNLVSAENRIQWEGFRIQDSFAINTILNIGVVSVSQKLIDFVLKFEQWNGFESANGIIGYGERIPNVPQGLTESEAYSSWLEKLKDSERIVRAQVPSIRITQPVFDALVSLHFDTGTWRTVAAAEGIYDVQFAIQQAHWRLAADMIQRGMVNQGRRRDEARIIQLADYPIGANRTKKITEGLQEIRRRYADGITNDYRRTQAEFVYYRQIATFLPGMSELRKRRILAKV